MRFVVQKCPYCIVSCFLYFVSVHLFIERSLFLWVEHIICKVYEDENIVNYGRGVERLRLW